MRQHATPLEGLVVIETVPRSDERGSFVRLFCENELESLRHGLHFTQINLSTTMERGALRGMHYQRSPMMECKLIRCLRGVVFDVAVDLRKGSPTFLKWQSVELSEGNQRQLFIPEGFAHGFQALSEDAQLLYMHTVAWSPEHEAGLRYDDPRVGIEWPVAVGRISDKDRERPLLPLDFEGLPQ